MAKRFMYVCLGILALAVVYHLGANSATSQPPETAIGFPIRWDTGEFCVLTDQGNIYYGTGPYEEWQLWCNFPGGGTTTRSTTWSGIKSMYR